MSAIGNFVAGAYDRTARTSGASLHQPYSIRHADDSEHEHELGSSSEQRSEAMRQLARQITQSSMHLGDRDRIFSKDRGPELDPLSSQFDARRWVRSLAELSQRDNPHLAGGRAGVAFKNLSVHGYGSNAGGSRL